MLILILGISNLTNIINIFDKEEANTIGIVDESGQYYDSFINQLEMSKSELITKKIEDDQEGESLVQDGKIKGYLIIQSDQSGLPSGVYKSDTISDESTSGELLQVLTTIKNQVYTEGLNISQEQISSLYVPAAFEKVAIEDNAKTAEELNQARGLVYIMLFVIYFGVIGYAGMIATEVAGEKTSRVMEILISSISPVQQMFAKILGIALLSLTQMIVFFAVGYTAIKNNLDDMQEGFFSYLGFGATSLSTVVYAIIFALLGYFLYATLAAFLGSLVSRIEDVQTMITPMTMLIIIGFMMSMFGLGNPEAGFVKVSSFIPFFSPMLMFLRVGMLEVPFWEIAASIGLLVATIVILAVFGARVYRGGVLMYGKATSFKNIKQALDLTKKQ